MFTKLYNAKNCVHVKLILCKATKKATMEDKEATFISSSNGWQSNRNYFPLRQGTSWYKEILNSCKHQIRIELPMGPWEHWWLIFCLTSWLNTCQKIAQRMIFASWNVVLSSAEFFRYDPHFLLRFTSGLRACSILITSLLAVCRYIALEGNYVDKDNLPCRHVKLSNCAKILLDRYARTCYNRTFHVLKLLKLRFC